MRKNRWLILLFLFALVIQGSIFQGVSVQAETDNLLNLQTQTINSSKKYVVQYIIETGDVLSFGAIEYESDNFRDAYEQMLILANARSNVVVRSNSSLSPMKIVAADRARVQSYPYRKGVVGSDTGGANTLKLYSNKTLTSNITYVSPHYQMRYYGTSVVSDSNSNLVLDVEINGARGYVDLNKVDIIPLIVFEKNMSITLGGDNGDYYNPAEKEDVIKVTADSYTVSYNSTYKVNELSVNVNRTYSTLGSSSITYAIAPSWLVPGVTYYSSNGINFYSDIDMKKPVNNGASYYAYYQWLPVRSMSNITADDLNSYIKNLGYTNTKGASKYSVIVGNEQVFIENGNLYGMNALLLFAQASLESAYGSSSYAVNRYNLFGWNAFDSNPDLAATYDGVEVSVEMYMSDQFQGYFLNTDWRNMGLSYGNKASGVTVRFASDPYYGHKVASIAYSIDRNSGFKDQDAYSLAVLKDQTAIPLYKDASTSSGSWYTTKSTLKNLVITNLGETSGFIKTNLSQPIKNNAVSSESLPVNLLTEFGYVLNSQVSSILSKTLTTSTAKVPTERIVVTKQNKTYVTTDDLNQRSSWTTNSRIITTIPKGTTVTSTGKSSNGWIRVLYNGNIGYVSPDYLDDGSGTGGVSIMLGDVNGDGVINAVDGLNIRRHLNGEITLTGTSFTAADINKDSSITAVDGLRMRRHLNGEQLIEQ